MTDPAGRHPDPALLEKLMRNDLDAAERRRVVRHLVSGCSRCVAITSQLWALGDPPDPSPAPALVIPDMPAMPAADPGDRVHGQPAGHGASYRDLFGRLTRAAQARERRVAAERRRAPRLVAELLRHPPAGRLGLVWSEKRFQIPPVCELLVETGRQAAQRRQVRGRGLELAELAVAACERLDPRLCGGAYVHALCAWAWAHSGNARRLAGDAVGAELAFARAELLFRESVSETVRRGSGLDRQEAEMLALEAELRAGQGRLTEAGRLLDRALALLGFRPDPRFGSGFDFGFLGGGGGGQPSFDAGEICRILIQKALLHGQAGNVRTAVELLRAAAGRLEALPDPAPAATGVSAPAGVSNQSAIALLACALHHLAALLVQAAASPQAAAPARPGSGGPVEAGDIPPGAALDPAALGEEALAALRRALPLYQALGDRPNEARLLRLQGEIDAALGRAQAAEASLLAARPALLREGLRREAAASLLDLAVLYARHGRLREMRGLAQRVPALLAPPDFDPGGLTAALPADRLAPGEAHALGKPDYPPVPCGRDRGAGSTASLGTLAALLVFDRLTETSTPAAEPATSSTADPTHADFFGEMARYLGPPTMASHLPCPPC
jgi:tetratricopeptide (TPR) repeat protein